MKTSRITNAEVTSSAPGSLEIRWTLHPPGQAVSVFVSNHHAAGEEQHQLLAEGVHESRLRLDGLAPARRHYFKLKTGYEAPVTVAERVVPLEGAHNFRDMGGYRTQSGQRIRWGCLYRSDYLVHLTDADCDYINGLQIRTVFDLRSNMERARYPSRWPAQSQVQTVSWEDSHESEKLGRRLQQFREQHPKDMDENMLGFLSLHYRRYLEMQACKYREILSSLAAEDTAPALIHCTAGKDRTGIISALLLHLLGVDEDTIMQDYLLTNQHVKGPDEEERFRLLLRQFGLHEISDRVFEAMLYAHPEYLRAAFDGMREDYGSVEDYVRTRLGFDDAMTSRLRSLYLE